MFESLSSNHYVDVTIESERLRNEAQGLAVNLKERSRKHQQTQELYDRLKRKQMTAVTQIAAQSAVNDSVDDLQWNGASGQGRRNFSPEDNEDSGGRFQRPGNLDHTLGSMMPPSTHRHSQQGGN